MSFWYALQQILKEFTYLSIIVLFCTDLSFTEQPNWNLDSNVHLSLHEKYQLPSIWIKRFLHIILHKYVMHYQQTKINFIKQIIKKLYFGLPGRYSSLPNRRIARNKSGGGKYEPFLIRVFLGISVVVGKMSHS